jgi:vitamin B12 transporter
LAQQDTSLYQLRTVEVFGKPAEVFASGSRVSTLDSSFVKTYTSGSLADVLQARTPVFLKTYGPAAFPHPPSEARVPPTPLYFGTGSTLVSLLWV